MQEKKTYQKLLIKSLSHAILTACTVIFDNNFSFSSQITLNSHACCSKSSNSAKKK
jgi:hypothetical protein